MATIQSRDGRACIDMDAGTISLQRSNPAARKLAALIADLLGRPYDEDTAHCWWLTALVQRAVYGRSVPGGDEPLPVQDDRARVLREGVEIHGWQEHPDPADGDIVMMSRFVGGPREHCGVYLAGRGVLHTDRPHGVVIDSLIELRHVRLWRPSFFRPA